ncbi:DUF202 domain-containing protein [Streptomyces sp. NPDC048506]|uniref:DUF202 domain-containing protein n=1 Tax=Streptomyces sp. NPDC048506 TaxID=3155028 RepID=UPI003429726B
MAGGARPGGPGPRPAADRDPGLQPERTRLAWRRTTLSATVVAMLAGRQLLKGGAPGPVELVVAALTGLLWIGFVALAHHRMRAMAGGRPPGMGPRTALLVVGCTLALALCGVVVAVLPGR